MPPQISQSQILKKLGKYSGAFQAARKQKNPYRTLDVPDGMYFGRLKTLALTQVGKKGEQDPAFRFSVVLICNATDVLDNGDEVPAGDMRYTGQQASILFAIRETKNSSIEENYARFMYACQDLGYDTELMIESETDRDPEIENQYTIEQLQADIAETAPLVVILVTTSDDQSTRFVNLRGLADQATIEEMIGQELGELSIPETGDDEEPPEEEAEIADEGGDDSGDDGAVEAAGEEEPEEDAEAEEPEPEPEPEEAIPPKRPAVAPAKKVVGKPPVKTPAAPAKKAAPAPVKAGPKAPPPKAATPTAPAKKPGGLPGKPLPKKK